MERVKIYAEDKNVSNFSILRSTNGAAGYDIKSAVSMTLKARSRSVVPTGIFIEIPIGYYGRIASKSGLSVKHGIEVGAGVIDSDYRGEIMVVLHNHGNEDIQIDVGMKIAQMIFEKCYFPDIVIVDKLSETKRGIGGFGSTGK
jgi:dUTP pyrophosphatase